MAVRVLEAAWDMLKRYPQYPDREHWTDRICLRWPAASAVRHRFLLSWDAADPETLARSLTIALVFGLFPIYGCPTVLCTAAALRLRLNMPLVQAVNFATGPLQLALTLPLARIGEWLIPIQLGHNAPFALSVAVWFGHAVAGWTCVGLPAAAILYISLLSGLRCRRPQPA